MFSTWAVGPGFGLGEDVDEIGHRHGGAVTFGVVKPTQAEEVAGPELGGTERRCSAGKGEVAQALSRGPKGVMREVHSGCGCECPRCRQHDLGSNPTDLVAGIT